jgi:transcriptional regulator with XRE-family HTH domain
MFSLRDIRKIKGLRQEDLEAATGVTQSHISSLETGRRELTPEVAKQLAPALGIDYVELFISYWVASLEEYLKTVPTSDCEPREKAKLHDERFHQVVSTIVELDEGLTAEDKKRFRSLLFGARMELGEMAEEELKARHQAAREATQEPIREMPNPMEWRKRLEERIRKPREDGGAS